MADSAKDRRLKRSDMPVENPKKLPADFPKQFDIDRNLKKGSAGKKKGKGARFHGSM